MWVLLVFCKTGFDLISHLNGACKEGIAAYSQGALSHGFTGTKPPKTLQQAETQISSISRAMPEKHHLASDENFFSPSYCSKSSTAILCRAFFHVRVVPSVSTS